jgi:hypothetical protein
MIQNLLQKSVTFAQALAVFRPTGCKTTFFSGCCCKTEVLQQPLHFNSKENTGVWQIHSTAARRFLYFLANILYRPGGQENTILGRFYTYSGGTSGFIIS